jgi:hypothetical protein
MATGPTLAGFLNFVRVNMGIPAAKLPDNSVYLSMSLAIALGIVNPALRVVPVPQADGAGIALNPLEPGTSVCTMYDLAVYNLAADNLINFTPDQPGFDFFAEARKTLKINEFVSGVVQSSGDEGTNVSMVVQKAAEEFTLANLQQLKTPWGRAYLAIAQSYGPYSWGLTGGGAP